MNTCSPGLYKIGYMDDDKEGRLSVWKQITFNYELRYIVGHPEKTDREGFPLNARYANWKVTIALGGTEQIQKTFGLELI